MCCIFLWIQVSDKNIAFLKEKSDQDFMERLEQVQLAEE